MHLQLCFQRWKIHHLPPQPHPNYPSRDEQLGCYCCLLLLEEV